MEICSTECGCATRIRRPTEYQLRKVAVQHNNKQARPLPSEVYQDPTLPPQASLTAGQMSGDAFRKECSLSASKFFQPYTKGVGDFACDYVVSLATRLQFVRLC